MKIKKLLLIMLISISAYNLHASESQSESKANVDTSVGDKKSAEEINSPENYQALFDAIEKGDFYSVQRLLDRGINPNIQIVGHGGFPLLYAVARKDINIINLLLRYEADINLQNNSGKTPLMRALYDTNLDMVKLLLSREAKVNLKDNNGYTALMNTMMYGTNEVIRDKLSCIAELLRHNADPNLQNDIGHTLLIGAVYSGCQDIVEFLLNQDNRKLINTDLQDNSGRTALMWAIENGDFNMVRLLLYSNVNGDVRDYSGRTALDIVNNRLIQTKAGNKIVEVIVYDRSRTRYVNRINRSLRRNKKHCYDHCIDLYNRIIDMLKFYSIYQEQLRTDEVSRGIQNIPVDLCRIIASYSGHATTSSPISFSDAYDKHLKEREKQNSGSHNKRKSSTKEERQVKKPKS